MTNCREKLKRMSTHLFRLFQLLIQPFIVLFGEIWHEAGVLVELRIQNEEMTTLDPEGEVVIAKRSFVPRI